MVKIDDMTPDEENLSACEIFNRHGFDAVAQMEWEDSGFGDQESVIYLKYTNYVVDVIFNLTYGTVKVVDSVSNEAYPISGRLFSMIEKQMKELGKELGWIG